MVKIKIDGVKFFGKRETKVINPYPSISIFNPISPSDYHPAPRNVFKDRTYSAGMTGLDIEL